MRRFGNLTFVVWGGVCALALVLSTGSSLLAGEHVDPDSYREYDIGDGTVTLDVQDAPLGQIVADRIQPRTRVNIVVAPEAAEQSVTLRVVDLYWIQALDTMVEKIGGVLIRRAPNLLRVERPLPVTFEFPDEDVRTVITMIAKFASASVILSEEVKGRITLSLTETPWRAALQAVVDTANYALVEEDYGLLRVVPIDQLDLETGYYRFRYLRPPVPYKGVMTTQGSGESSDGGGGSSAAEIIQNNVYVPSDNPSEIEENFPILAALRLIVSQEGGDVRYIAAQNNLIYTGTRPKIDALKDMLRELDVEPPQVFIDMNFIITTNNDALNLGLQGTQGVGVGYSGSDIVHMMPFNLGGGTGDLADAITGTVFPSPAGSAFTYGRLSFSQTDLLLQFLQRDTSSRVVQAPKLLALDNQEATLFVGESIRYARTTAATNQNGGLTYGVEEDPNSPINVGFQLLVIPNVIRGEGKVMMTVIPQRSALCGTTSPIIGFDRFEISGQTIDLPRVQSSTLKTAMILRDGETAVIGGMIEDSERETVEKVPIIGDIPLVGLIFQGTDRTKRKGHLLITITPRLLKGTDAANPMITQELAGRSQAVAAEWSDLYGRAVQDYPRAPCVPRPVQPRSGTVRQPSPPPPPPPPAPMTVAPAR